jgi:hypothetical protein
MVVSSVVRMGEIYFNSIIIENEKGSEFIKANYYDRTKNKSHPFYHKIHGPRFLQLSEPL